MGKQVAFVFLEGSRSQTRIRRTPQRKRKKRLNSLADAWTCPVQWAASERRKSRSPRCFL